MTIAITPLRTSRLEVRLRELSIGDEINLCYAIEGQHEMALSEFLRRVVEAAEAPSDRHEVNPRAWTAGERYLALAHYNMHVREDAPDYAVTESTKLSDYLARDREARGEKAVFEAIGYQWVFNPATGAVLESLEALQIGSELKGRAFWLMGLMAAQLLRVDEKHPAPDPISDVPGYSDWLKTRIEVMRSLPSSDSEKLYEVFRVANEKATQFFRVWFDEEGVIVMPKEAAGRLPAARFLVHSGFSELALSLTGKSQ